MNKWEPATKDAAVADAVALRAMRLTAFNNCEDLWWRVDNGVLSVMIHCNDIFTWGCADAEVLTEQNIDLLEQTFAECKEKFGVWGNLWAATLFCARSRKMRPQGAVYRHIDPEWHELFDACGPEREPGMFNPYSQYENTDTTMDEKKRRQDEYRMEPYCGN